MNQTHHELIVNSIKVDITFIGPWEEDEDDDEEEALGKAFVVVLLSLLS